MAFAGRVVALIALIMLGFVLFTYASESSVEAVADVEDVASEQELLDNASAEELEQGTKRLLSNPYLASWPWPCPPALPFFV